MSRQKEAIEGRFEWPLVLALSVAGASLRFWGFGSVGLTHFDEGVYALAGLWPWTRGGLAGVDPQFVAYAPPGFPMLVGLAYSVLGVSDLSAVLVSTVCGVLTIPAAAWVARRTFGPGAGAAAAAFAAMSWAHIAFSRKALTDAPFLSAWLVTIGLGGRFLEKPGLGRALALGLTVGLAQNLKYNGWIAGGMVALAALHGLAVSPEARSTRAIARTFGFGMVAAAVAGLTYLPWYLYVEGHGGYADLIRHHRSYLGGPESWLPRLKQQLAQVVGLSGGVAWSGLTWAVAWLGGAGGAGRLGLLTRRGNGGTAARVGLLLGCAVLGGVLDAGWWAGMVGCALLATDPAPASRLLVAWWVVLSVMTPFYHPYARLWLPLHAAGWVLLAGAVVRLGPFHGERDKSGFGNLVTGWRARLALVASVAVLSVARLHTWGEPPEPLAFGSVFAPSDDVKLAVAELELNSAFPKDGSATLDVYARRPVAFYLAVGRKTLYRLLPDASPLMAEDPPGAWYLVDEAMFPDLSDEGDISSARHSRGGAWRRLETYETTADPVTLLDIRPAAVYDGLNNPYRLLLMVPYRTR
jgi:4-amino-4-deoxy-L-arabinose transferase-like glycosyltransferase